ncbi:MAG: peptide chain release factor 3 [Deltaproteobacteria bacterium]|jgi:peptide chain release factor 3|nr:peptide chain release factor 3 [Deltaproteobacteria bacterium]
MLESQSPSQSSASGGNTSGSSPETTTEIQRRRTFAIISHPDAGKTTLTEKLLYNGGVIHEAGEVKGKQGTKAATSDWMALEQQRGISITSSVMQFEYKGLRVNLLDTPGHKDFSEDTYRTLVAADSAVMLIDVAKGVEERTKKLYEVCRYRNVPIFTFINKCDREGKAPLELIDEIETTLKMACWPVTWPVGLGGLFFGLYHRTRKVIYPYQGRDGDLDMTPIPVSSLDQPGLAEKIRPEVLQALKEEIELIDGTLGEFDHQAFLDGKLSPATFGSAKQDFGVDLFLDLFKEWAPPPGPRKTKTDIVVNPLDSAFTGFVFKMQANMDRRHRDRVAFIRICSGKFQRGMKVHHMRLDREVRLAFSSQFVAQDRETVDEAFAGDIVGVNDTGNFQIGDTITTGKKLLFEDIPKFPPELFGRLQVSDAMKRTKLQKGVQQLSEEGAIQLFIDPIVGPQDPIIGVVGELQFEVLLYRLEDEYGLDVKLARTPYTVARWPRDKDGKPVKRLNGNLQMFEDASGNPVILLAQEWDLNWAKKENPDIEFATSILQVREGTPGYSL